MQPGAAGSKVIQQHWSKSANTLADGAQHVVGVMTDVTAITLMKHELRQSHDQPHEPVLAYTADLLPGKEAAEAASVA